VLTLLQTESPPFPDHSSVTGSYADRSTAWTQVLQMSHAISLERTQPHAADATIDAIARETAVPADFVKALYEEESARLNAQARLKQFVSVIAIKRVKQRLRKLNPGHR
jgi:Protein of unknown function (DUF3562)